MNLDTQIDHGPSYCDVEPSLDRINKLRFVFYDIGEATMGIVTPGDFAQAGRVLDLGMGKGSVGGIMRQLNPDCQLVGVDINDYQKDNLYHLYQRRVMTDLEGDEFFKQISDEPPFDLIIGIGLPNTVIDHLLAHSEELMRLMSPRGVCVLVTDYPYEYPFDSGRNISPFNLFKGAVEIDTSIFVSRKTQEANSRDRLIQLLSSRHGVIFFPKRDLPSIPIVTSERLRELVAGQDLASCSRMIEYLQEFLEKPAIGDGWGKNQSGRLEWISAMRKRYGNDFSDLYHIQDNQFRGNVLAFARVALDHLLTSIRDNGQTALATNLEQILREIKESYKNSHYNEQESLQEKLKLVHLFEDKIIEALQLLTGSSSTMGHAG